MNVSNILVSRYLRGCPVAIVGESGVSICTVDDMKNLYAGFDRCAPNTSVSITINGPAPMMLAYFFNAAIEQHHQ